MIRLGVIGGGRIGRTHIQCIHNYIPDASVYSLADQRCNNELVKWADSFGIKNVTANYHDILSDPHVDAVMVCTPTPTHTSISIQAMQAGKHVFCEKPIAINTQEIIPVSKVIRATGLKFQIGFMKRFDHNYREMIQAASTGKLGRLQIARITSRDPAPPTLDYLRSSGGIFLDMMVHDFDLARCMLQSEPVSVFTDGACLIDDRIGAIGDIDTATATIHMENGAMAIIESTRACAYGYDQRAEIMGTKGMASVANDIPNTVSFTNKAGCTSGNPIGFFLERFMNAYTSELKSFIKAIRDNVEPEVGIKDAINNHVLALAATISNKEKRPILIKDIKEKEGLRDS